MFARNLTTAGGNPLGELRVGYHADAVVSALRADAITVAASVLVSMVVFAAGMILLIRGVTGPLRSCVRVVERSRPGISRSRSRRGEPTRSRSS